MHVSQQTETFFFGPTQGPGWEKVRYFQALSSWTEGFGMAHVPPDYVFDADFTPEFAGPLQAVVDAPVDGH